MQKGKKMMGMKMTGGKGKGKDKGKGYNNDHSYDDHYGYDDDHYYDGKGEYHNEPCKPIPVYFFIEELAAAFDRNEVGGGFDNVPFYHSETSEQLGTYSDSATDLASGDCVGTGAFSFNYDPPYLDQIHFSFTCNGEFNAVTGGTGAFGCATGFEEFVFDDGVVIASVIYVCGDLCPYNKEQHKLLL